MLAHITERTPRSQAATADPTLAAAFARASRDGDYTDAFVLAALDAYVYRRHTFGPARLATGIRRSLALAMPARTTAATFETLSGHLVRYALRDRGRAVGLVRVDA